MFQHLIERIARELERHALTYMLIGGQAVLLYGEPRLTKDIDVTVGAGPDQLPHVLDAVRDLGLKPLVESPREFVGQTMVLPCLDPDSGIRVDVIFSVSPYEQQALQRVRRVKMGETDVCFVSPEDLIIHKVIAGRPRDIEDVKTVLLKQSGLDLVYLRTWLQRFSTELGEPFDARFESTLRDIG